MEAYYNNTNDSLSWKQFSALTESSKGTLEPVPVCQLSRVALMTQTDVSFLNSGDFPNLLSNRENQVV